MTEPTPDAAFVPRTRVFYDAIAEEYAGLFRGNHLAKPLDRAVLTAFAELALPEAGPVADLGCGPGRVTAFLAAQGLPVYGVDLSEGMLAVARREHPALRFEQGSILELAAADGSLGGAVSWYSTIHTPLDRLPSLFAEFRRVLAPGAPLLLAFQAGDVPRTHDRPWGHPVTLDFERRRPERMAELLGDAGFEVRHRLVSEPEPSLDETTPHAYLIARR
ncbi:class I SAM-dependent methyltransferase [Streptomyces sp. CRN 30]|uniref:class I SAM-dependent DNA methyltransferase n=1 Tax=Streptomyces sp. CRN 30 TaxID=3075613 RepID=UPI002A840EE8|nr:class I SAM-dependent methyltransferase [Streptomyces sp. CRN 30]